MKVKNMNTCDWEDTFKPIKNHIDSDSPYEGTMFETYGEELNFVRTKAKHNPFCVWTLMDSDEDDDTIIVEGFHFVNRLGYFITEIPFDKGTNYVVKD
jgi:hypothetical protein